MKKSYEHVWEKWTRGDLEQQIKLHYENRKKYLELISRYLNDVPGARALEVGCGSSIDAHIIAEKANAEIFGIDISEEALKIAGSLAGYFKNRVHLSRGNARQLEFKKGSFDLVFSQGLIEHFEEPVSVLKEQVRILKPGGVLVINVPQKYTAYTVYKHLMALFGRWEWGSETEFSNWQLSMFGDYLGLEFLEKCGYDYWRSPFEIVFVLRTLNHKFEKIPLVRNCPSQKTISQFWEKMWKTLEDRYGYLFMKNAVYVYRKPSST